MDDEVEWLTVKQFAARHATILTEWKVGEMVRRGELPHIRLGNSKAAPIAIPADALDQLRAQQEKNGRAA
jgi:hypothetical protein